jgi:AmmeMemoRadiSam system protein A
MTQRSFIFVLVLFLFCFIGCGEERTSANQFPAQTEESSSPEGLAPREKEFLLKLARQVLEAYLENRPIPKLDQQNLAPVLLEKRGCFVTLEKNHQLRGCIGYLQPRKALVEAVVENAINAAVRDHRFPRVTREELDLLSIEISVLTVPRLMAYKTPDDLLTKLIPERDGIILKSPYHQSTYLPQVWKQIPKKEDFLSRLCLKGGAEADCWKDPSTEIYCYQAQVYKEEN